MPKKAYFISDLHLGARYMGDVHECERRVVRWLDTVSHDMAQLYLLGDVLDYWFEYRHVVPRGYVRFLGKLAELSDNGVRICWLIGNHDIWIFDYLPRELGIEVIDGSTVRDILGSRFFLAHGDGVGRHPLGFRFLRALFRNRLCQKLYAAVHPRWTVPLAHGWSSHNRQLHQGNEAPEAPDFRATRQYIEQHAQQHPDIDYYILGHFHIVEDIVLHGKSHLVVLGDWINKFSYASFDGNKLEINYFNK